MFYLAREVRKFGHVLAEKKNNFITINEFKYEKFVKPEKFRHLHLVYHFTVPSSISCKWFLSIPLKLSGNQRFSDDFRGYRKRSVA